MTNQHPGAGDYWGNNPGWQATPYDSPYGGADFMGHPGQGGYSGAPVHGTGGYAAAGQWAYQPPPPPPAENQNSTILALVFGVLGTMMCMTNLFAVVFAAVALSKDRNQAEMDRFTRYAWISNWIHIGLAVCFTLFIITVIVAA